VYMMRFLVLAVAAMVVGGAHFAQAEIPAAAVQISTPAYTPLEGDFEPALGSYEYDVSWQGIPAATVNVEITQDGPRYRIVAAAETASAIDLFYRLRYRAEGIISALDLLPVRTVIDQRENSRHKNTRISFLESGEIESVRWKSGKDTEVIRFNPNNFTLDPFSAAFLARSLPWESGQVREFDTFNGKTRYLISLTAREKIRMTVNGTPRDVWVISPRVRNLTNPEKAGKLREAKIYVTADSSREILQIVSEVFIGSVTTKLASFAPARVLPPVQVAQRQRVAFKFF